METFDATLLCADCGKKVSQSSTETSIEAELPCPDCGGPLRPDEDTRSKLIEIAREEALKHFSRVPGFKPK